MHGNHFPLRLSRAQGESTAADRNLACSLVSDMLATRKLEFKDSDSVLEVVEVTAEDDGSVLDGGNDCVRALLLQIKMIIDDVDAPHNSLLFILSKVSSAPSLLPLVLRSLTPRARLRDSTFVRALLGAYMEIGGGARGVARD